MNPAFARRPGFDEYGRCNGVMPRPAVRTTCPEWEGLIADAQECLRSKTRTRFELPPWALEFARKLKLNPEECRAGVVAEAYQRSVEDVIARQRDHLLDLLDP